MKLIFTSLLLCCFLLVEAQNSAEATVRSHKGFYLSMGVGPVFGNINMKSNELGEVIYSGVGAIFDFKIGGAIKENLILHGSLMSSTMAGPEVKTSAGSGKSSNNINLGEAMIGGGLTYYIMPENISFSGSLGLGNFTVINNDTDVNVSTERGISMQIKLGKEWFVSKKWGLGVAATYGKTSVNNTPGGGLQEKLNSNRFGIMFSASLN